MGLARLSWLSPTCHGPVRIGYSSIRLKHLCVTASGSTTTYTNRGVSTWCNECTAIFQASGCVAVARIVLLKPSGCKWHVTQWTELRGSVYNSVTMASTWPVDCPARVSAVLCSHVFQRPICAIFLRLVLQNPAQP